MREPHEGTLLTDLLEFGPAPMMTRELVVIDIALLAAVFAPAGPSPLFWAGAGAAVVYLAARFAIGVPAWNRVER